MKLSVTNANTFWLSLKGLIGATHAFPLFFTTRFGIHTFGVRFPIDVVILDNQNHVVVCKKNLSPNRLFFWQPTWNRVIELPKGTITKRRITIGMIIDLMFTN